MALLASKPEEVDLVLQGGGIKAIALVGGLATLEERGIAIRQLAGASGGAIVAGLAAAGYSAADLRRIIETEDFPALLDSHWFTRLPGIGKPLALIGRMGLHSGDRVRKRLAELLAEKDIRTFGDLRARSDVGNGIEPLQIVVSDVTARRLLLFPRDARLFGIEPDDLDVALSLRTSSSIPAVYEPVRLKSSDDGAEHLLVDGGMLSNFPLWVYDRSPEPAVPVIGLRLYGEKPRDSIAERLPGTAFARTRVGRLIDYVESIARTMMEAHDRRYLDRGDIARTIHISTGNVGTTEFDLSPERMEMLYLNGKNKVASAIDEDD